MSSFLLQNFNGGEREFENRGIKGAYKHGQALDIRKKVDSLSCQQALAEEGSGVIVDLIMFIVPCSDGNAYGFGDTGKIYKRTSASNVRVFFLIYTTSIKKYICIFFFTPVSSSVLWKFFFFSGVTQKTNNNGTTLPR